MKAVWSFLSVIVDLVMVSDKRPQITQDLDSSFKCTGCSREWYFLNRTRTAGTRDTVTRVLLVIQCTCINLYWSNFPLSMTVQGKTQRPAAAVSRIIAVNAV